MPEWRLATGDKKADAKAFAAWCEEQNERVARQRSLWHALYPNSAKDRLLKGILDRAWELLDMGECDAADALLEFVPQADGQKLLNEFFPDSDQ